MSAFTDSIVLKTFVLLIIIYVLKLLWSRRKLYILSMKLPGPVAYPIFGNALNFKIFTDFRNIVNLIYEKIPIYGDICRIWLGPDLNIIISEANDIEAVLLSKDTATKGSKYKLLCKALGPGLLTASGDVWKRHRHIINPSFSGISCKRYQRIHDKHARHMAENLMKLKETGPVDVSIHSLRFAGDIIAEALFEDKIKFYQGQHDQYLHIIPRMAILLYERLSRIWLANDTIYYNLTKSGKIMADNIKLFHSFHHVRIHKIIDDLLLKKKLNRESKNEETMTRKNSIELMVDCLYEGEFTRQEIIDEFMNIYSPGTDTIYSHLCFFLLMMGMHKRCQDLVWHEIKEIFSEYLDAPVTNEVLSKLPYLSMCLKEVRRLFPSGPIQLRLLEKDFYLKHRDLVIPAGTSFLISNFVLHRNLKYWDNPDKYIPERFSREASAKRPHFAYIPFSAGLRNCIGQAFGEDMLKTVAIHLLRKLEFHSDLTMDTIQLHADISTRCIQGYHLEIKQRI